MTRKSKRRSSVVEHGVHLPVLHRPEPGGWHKRVRAFQIRRNGPGRLSQLVTMAGKRSCRPGRRGSGGVKEPLQHLHDEALLGLGQFGQFLRKLLDPGSGSGLALALAARSDQVVD